MIFIISMCTTEQYYCSICDYGNNHISKVYHIFYYLTTSSLKLRIVIVKCKHVFDD